MASRPHITPNLTNEAPTGLPPKLVDLLEKWHEDNGLMKPPCSAGDTKEMQNPRIALGRNGEEFKLSRFRITFSGNWPARYHIWVLIDPRDDKSKFVRCATRETVQFYFEWLAPSDILIEDCCAIHVSGRRVEDTAYIHELWHTAPKMRRIKELSQCRTLRQTYQAVPPGTPPTAPNPAALPPYQERPGPSQSRENIFTSPVISNGNAASNSTVRSANLCRKRELDESPSSVLALPVDKVARTGNSSNVRGRGHGEAARTGTAGGLSGDQRQSRPECRESRQDNVRPDEDGSVWEGCDNEESASRAGSSGTALSPEATQLPINRNIGTSEAAITKDNQLHSASAAAGSDGNQHQDEAVGYGSAHPVPASMGSPVSRRPQSPINVDVEPGPANVEVDGHAPNAQPSQNPTEEAAGSSHGAANTPRGQGNERQKSKGNTPSDRGASPKGDSGCNISQRPSPPVNWRVIFNFRGHRDGSTENFTPKSRQPGTELFAKARKYFETENISMLYCLLYPENPQVHRLYPENVESEIRWLERVARLDGGIVRVQSVPFQWTVLLRGQEIFRLC